MDFVTFISHALFPHLTKSFLVDNYLFKKNKRKDKMTDINKNEEKQVKGKTKNNRPEQKVKDTIEGKPNRGKDSLKTALPEVDKNRASTDKSIPSTGSFKESKSPEPKKPNPVIPREGKTKASVPGSTLKGSTVGSGGNQPGAPSAEYSRDPNFGHDASSAASSGMRSLHPPDRLPKNSRESRANDPNFKNLKDGSYWAKEMPLDDESKKAVDELTFDSLKDLKFTEHKDIDNQDVFKSKLEEIKQGLTEEERKYIDDHEPRFMKYLKEGYSIDQIREFARDDFRIDPNAPVQEKITEGITSITPENSDLVSSGLVFEENDSNGENNELPLETSFENTDLSELLSPEGYQHYLSNKDEFDSMRDGMDLYLFLSIIEIEALSTNLDNGEELPESFDSKMVRLQDFLSTAEPEMNEYLSYKEYYDNMLEFQSVDDVFSAIQHNIVNKEQASDIEFEDVVDENYQTSQDLINNLIEAVNNQDDSVRAEYTNFADYYDNKVIYSDVDTVLDEIISNARQNFEESNFSFNEDDSYSNPLGDVTPSLISYDEDEAYDNPNASSDPSSFTFSEDEYYDSSSVDESESVVSFSDEEIYNNPNSDESTGEATW